MWVLGNSGDKRAVVISNGGEATGLRIWFLLLFLLFLVSERVKMQCLSGEMFKDGENDYGWLRYIWAVNLARWGWVLYNFWVAILLLCVYINCGIGNHI
jgi:hypothetical protein